MSSRVARSLPADRSGAPKRLTPRPAGDDYRVPPTGRWGLLMGSAAPLSNLTEIHLTPAGGVLDFSRFFADRLAQGSGFGLVLGERRDAASPRHRQVGFGENVAMSDLREMDEFNDEKVTSIESDWRPVVFAGAVEEATRHGALLEDASIPTICGTEATFSDSQDEDDDFSDDDDDDAGDDDDFFLDDDDDDDDDADDDDPGEDDADDF